MVGSQRPFFRELRNRITAQRADGKSARWADVVATLIANNHAPERIATYTYRQVMLYYEAAMRRECMQRANLTADMSFARAKPEETLRHIKALSNF